SVGKVRLPLTKGLVGASVCEDNSIFLEFAAKDSRFEFFPETGEEKYSSMAAVPFSKNGVVTGVLTVQTLKPYSFTTTDRHFLEILVTQIGQAANVAVSLQTLKKRKESVFGGIPASPGVAEARVHILATLSGSVEIIARGFKGVKFEKQLFKNAVSKSLKEIDSLTKQVDKSITSASQIFSAQKMILVDSEFSGKVLEQIEKHSDSAPRAVSDVMGEYIRRFSTFKNQTLKEKGQDLKDLKNIVLKHMGEKVGRNSPKLMSEKMIVIASELTPQETVKLDLNRVKGFVTEKGSEFSHAAILARSLQIPAIVGVENILERVKPGDRILIDGTSGIVKINPDSKVIGHYLSKSETTWKRYDSLRKELEKTAPENQITTKNVSLLANIGLPFEIEHAKKECLESVGLLRTEFFYMQQKRWPSLLTQTRYYEKHLKSFSNGTVTIRLLDIGGDKFLSYMPGLKEDKSELGFRSVRLLLDHSEILRSQLQAIHRAATSTGMNPKILIPMVTHAWEIEAVREIMMLETGKAYSLGIMVEIPIALFQIKALTQECDFISVGTNDLAQYLLAVDRNNPRVTHLFQPLHPALLRALHFLFKEVTPLAKSFSVCGEMAGNSLSALALLILGYRKFSVSP
ncbi:MAG: phosphoenolpyruvate--protein phosphotransferase, partial [Nitrospinota bacterium]